MNIQVNSVDARVLGCLIEKDLATPEYYPLTLKSLTAACNQKSNRNPVMALSDREVVRSLDRLRDVHLVCEARLAGSRVPKYEHNLQATWNLGRSEAAAICVLLLRGPQTPGQVRSRSGRMHGFQDLERVERTLANLQTHQEGPFVVELVRFPGQKERRFAHLFCGEPKIEEAQTALTPERATVEVRAENERLEQIEATVQSLQDQVNRLAQKLEEFVRQFE